MSLLSLQGLEKRYGGISALAGAGFTIDKPGIVGLIGPNGAGKTTLFDAVAGDTVLDAGSIHLDGRRVSGLPSHRVAALGVARSFQECRVLPDFSCLDNLLFCSQDKSLGWSIAQVFTRSGGERARLLGRARELLAMVNLEAYADEPAASLSFGQRRLLEIVGAFIGEPRVLLLDEPAAGVNPAMLEVLSAFIARMYAERPCVFLVVEHNMEFIMALAHEVVVMHQGAVLERGPPEAVQASDRVLEAYLG